jgi:two-component system response regulator YesN
VVLREKFLHDLMKGLLPVSVNISEKIKEYQIDFSRFIILNLCHISTKKSPGNDCRDKSLLDCSLKIFREIFSEVHNMVIITESLQSFAAVLETVSMKDDWKERVGEMASNVSDLLREKLEVICHIGISETRNDAEEMFDCYNQSVYALETAKMKDQPVLFFEDLDYSLPKNTYPKTIMDALDYIDRNFQDDISLKDVAEAVYLNVWYLSDLFRREVGKTFSEYVKHKRIELAKKLLRESSMKLYEIAYHVGIREQSYFSSLFKKETGMTPKQYRELTE